MLNSRSSTYRAIVNSLVLMILILIPIATSTTTNGTFKIVDLSTVSTPDKSIYYDLNSRQSFEIVTGDASRLPTGPIFESRNGTCECQGFVCGCCAGIRVDLFNFDRKTCANLTFKGEDLSIQVNLLVDDVSYFHTKVSGTNPPPLCVPLYFFPIINFCGRIFNLGVQNNNLHACVDFETKISQWPIFILHFRCIKIGLNGIDWSDRTTESAIFKPLIDLTLPFSSNQTSGISFFSSEVYDDVAFEPENIENPATTVAMSDEEALMISPQIEVTDANSMQSLTVCRRGQFKDSISSLNSSSITITSPIIMNFYYTLFLTFFAHLSCSEASEKFENSLELKQTNVTTTNTNTSTVITARPRPCSCGGGVCSCCVQLFSNLWRQKTCVNVTYDADEFSFTTKVSMNDRVLYTRTVSGKNPRPICVPVPRLPILRACVRLYNIYFQGRNMHACVSMEGKFNDSTVFKVGLDCIRLGTNGVALVTPEDGGGLGQIEFFPASESDEEDDYDDEDDDDDDDDDYY